MHFLYLWNLFVYLQIRFIFAKYFCEYTNLFFVFVEGVYIYRLHIYTQIVDLHTHNIMKQI